MDTLRRANNFSEALTSVGKYREADRLNQRALEGRKTRLGQEHPDILTSMANLALTYLGQGRWN